MIRRDVKWLWVVALTVGAMGLAACSGDDEPATWRDGPAEVSTSTTRVFVLEAFCASFQAIAAHGRTQGEPGQSSEATAGQPAGPAQPTSKKAWDERIALTAKIIDVAPPDLVDNAKVYLGLVRARAQLAADHEYALVSELPPADRDAFIAEHRDEQLQANEVIAFVRDNCTLTL